VDGEQSAVGYGGGMELGQSTITGQGPPNALLFVCWNRNETDGGQVAVSGWLSGASECQFPANGLRSIAHLRVGHGCLGNTKLKFVSDQTAQQTSRVQARVNLDLVSRRVCSEIGLCCIAVVLVYCGATVNGTSNARHLSM